MACIAKRRGRYVIDFYDHTGQRRWETLKKGSTKQQATQVLREIEEQIARGTYIPRRQIPVFSEVAKEWLNAKKLRLRETTWEVYDGHVRNHFNTFKDIRIDRITTATVEKYILEKQEAGTKVGTVRKILVSLGQIFKFAVRRHYINYNPVREAERPRIASGGKEETPVLSPAEIRSLLEAVGNQKYRTLILLAVMTGARQGELLGLKWADIDFSEAQIQIRRTFNKARFFEPKTETSRRSIDIAPVVVRELRKWKLACPVNDLDLVFPNEEGKPMNYSNLVQRHFLPALRTAGIKRVRWHDLRHTYASILLEQGESVKYVQTQLGHSSPVVTMNVYAHLLKKTNQEAACRLESRIFGE